MIKHEWNGTVLTITSDSGTTSADLKGAKGDTGARGARGLGADSSVNVLPYEILSTTTTDEIVRAILLDGFSADKILIEVDVPPTGEGARGVGHVIVNGSPILYNEGFTDPSTTRRARIVVSIKNGYLNVDYSYSLRDNNSLDWREFQIRSTFALGIAATDIHSVKINTAGEAWLPAGTTMTIKGVRSNA